MICSWKPVFLQDDNIGIPASGVNENIAVLKEIHTNDKEESFFCYSLYLGLTTIAIASCINIWYGKWVWRSTLEQNAVWVGCV